MRTTISGQAFGIGEFFDDPVRIGVVRAESLVIPELSAFVLAGIGLLSLDFYAKHRKPQAV